MKCYKCNKPIPSVSTVCPYCSAPVDPNYKGEVNFGDISNIDYDEKNDLKAYIQEPKNKRVVIIAIVSILLVIIIFGALILSMLKPSGNNASAYFNGTINTVYDYIYDNYLGSNNSSSGKYKLNININGAKNEFKGNYERDVKSRIFKVDGIMRDPNEDSGGIILESKDFAFDSYMKDNDLYFKSDQLFNNYLYFNIPDESGLLTTKNYSLDLLIGGVSDALLETLKTVNYQSENTNINYRGVNTSVKRHYLELDNASKREFLKSFYNELIEDANFVNEYARINSKTADETVEILKNKISDAEFRYSGNSNDKTVISIYAAKKNVLRYSLDIYSDKHEVYQIDIKNNKYFFDYYLDDENKISATLSKTEETISNERNIKYFVTFDYDKNVIDLVLELKLDERSLVKRENIENSKDFGLISEEEKNIIKNNLTYYTSDTKIVDYLADKFKEKCVLGLDCNCEENKDTCTCLVGEEMITCDRDKVISPPANPNISIE